MAKAAFMRKGELLRGNISKDLKKRMVKALVWSVTLYGSETWTLRKEDIKCIQTFEMWIWCKMEKISWTAHVSNEEVLCLVQEQCLLVQVIKQRQANWTGHVLRHDCLMKTVLEGKIEGKRPRGKPRRKMLDLLLMKQEDKKITYNLQGAEERSTDPGRMAPSSVEPALGQGTQEDLCTSTYVASAMLHRVKTVCQQPQYIFQQTR